MAVIEQLFQNIQNVGFQRLLLPFLLIFVLLYGVLRRLELFDDDGGNKVDIALSLIGSLIVVGYTPYEGVFYAYVTNMFGALAILLIAILAFHLLESLARGDDDDAKSKYAAPYAWGAGLVVLLLFIGYGGLDMLTGARFSGDVRADVFFFLNTADLIFFSLVAVTIAFMAWVVSGEEDNGGGSGG